VFTIAIPSSIHRNRIIIDATRLIDAIRGIGFNQLTRYPSPPASLFECISKNLDITMRFSIASLAALVSIAYADNGNDANDESKEGSLKNIHPSLPSSLLSPSSIKTEKQPPSRDRIKYFEMRSYLREKLFRRRLPGVLHNAVDHDLELDLPEPLELCGKHSLGVLDGSHGACSSKEDVCVSVDEQGMESSTPYDEYSDTYGICVSRFLAETYHFQPVNYDDAAGDAVVYIEEDHRMLMPDDAVAASSDCESLCYGEDVFEVVDSLDFYSRIRSCYDDDVVDDDYGYFSFGNDNITPCPEPPINCWDTSKVDNMNEAFYELYYFNEPVHCLDTSGVTSMRYMFDEAAAFNQPLEAWNVSSVTDMDAMFYMYDRGAAFNQPLEAWDVSSVNSMYNMFRNAAAFNQPLEAWDVSSVNDMNFTFNNAAAFNQCLSTWASKTPSNVSTYSMFGSSGCLGVSSPDPTVAPWCQREVDGCFAPSSNSSQTPSTSPLPSTSPSIIPSALPSAGPSQGPSVNPSDVPSSSSSPSASPSSVTSVMPSTSPSIIPSALPSAGPSQGPSVNPSDVPSSDSSSSPSASPSSVTSVMPSTVPSAPKSLKKTKATKKSKIKKSTKAPKKTKKMKHVPKLV